MVAPIHPHLLSSKTPSQTMMQMSAKVCHPKPLIKAPGQSLPNKTDLQNQVKRSCTNSPLVLHRHLKTNRSRILLVPDRHHQHKQHPNQVLFRTCSGLLLASGMLLASELLYCSWHQDCFPSHSSNCSSLGLGVSCSSVFLSCRSIQLLVCPVIHADS